MIKTHGLPSRFYSNIEKRIKKNRKKRLSDPLRTKANLVTRILHEAEEGKRNPETLRKPWTPIQLAIADCLADPMDARTLKQLAMEFGTYTQTIWKWRKDPEYIRLINDKVDDLRQKARAPIYKTLVQQATKATGFKDRKLYFALTGELVNKTEVKETDDFGKYSDQELKQIADKLIADTRTEPN